MATILTLVKQNVIYYVQHHLHLHMDRINKLTASRKYQGQPKIIILCTQSVPPCHCEVASPSCEVGSADFTPQPSYRIKARFYIVLRLLLLLHVKKLVLSIRHLLHCYNSSSATLFSSYTVRPRAPTHSLVHLLLCGRWRWST